MRVGFASTQCRTHTNEQQTATCNMHMNKQIVSEQTNKQINKANVDMPPHLPMPEKKRMRLMRPAFWLVSPMTDIHVVLCKVSKKKSKACIGDGTRARTETGRKETQTWSRLLQHGMAWQMHYFSPFPFSLSFVLSLSSLSSFPICPFFFPQ